MKKNATEHQIREVIEKINDSGLKPHISKGEVLTIIGMIGNEWKVPESQIRAMEGVAKIMPILSLTNW